MKRQIHDPGTWQWYSKSKHPIMLTASKKHPVDGLADGLGCVNFVNLLSVEVG